MRKIFHELRRLDEVLSVVSSYVELKPLGVESVSLRDGFGRVLAEDVYAVYDYPPFDRSEVDGYAVNSVSLVGVEEDSPTKLKLKGIIKIGNSPDTEVGVGEAVEVDTGAAIPRGADSVVMVEYSKRVGDYVYVYTSVVPGDNVARTGSDIMKGELVLRGGTLLGPAELATLAAAGVSRVKVFVKPKVGIISVGSELVSVEEGILQDYKIFEVTSHYIASSLLELGATPKFYGVVPDSEDVLERVLKRALDENDLVITAGGTSAGIGDLTYRVIGGLGEPGIIIHGLRVKPGKPTIVAVVGGKLVFGLPGFPLSAAMIFRSVVVPIISRLAGLPPNYWSRSEVKALVLQKVLGVRGRTTLVPVALVERRGVLIAYPILSPSGSIKVLTYADGFIEVPEDTLVVSEGSEVVVKLFRRFWKAPELVFIGSHDYIVDELIKLVTEGPNYKLINAGSLGGLLAVGRGEADLCGTHLLDEENNEYNLPYIKKLNLVGQAVLVGGWVREIGFILPRNNPKKIESFKDLFREDVVFINRNKGSGTRTLIDINLRIAARELGIEPDKIPRVVRGYSNEAKTHNGVAVAVLQGRADVGVGVRYAAEMYGLEFIKIGEEIYDLVIRKESKDKKPIRKILEILSSEKIEKILSNYVGYKTYRNTGKIIME
ncbi:MAG: molybdopterin biosynthesis protein [Desulfurococcaceae archaeon TW002]